MKKYIYASIVFLLIFITIMISYIFGFEYIEVMDKNVFSFVHSGRNQFLDYYFVLFSYLGESYTIIALCALLLILPNRRRIGLPVGIVTGVSALINFCIKNIIARPRPDKMYFITNAPFNYPFPSSYSFPSGHSQTSFLFFVVLIVFLICNYGKVKKVFPIIITAAYIFGVNFCFARIYLGVHYPSDVFAGFSLMMAISLFVIGYVNNIPYCRYVHVTIDRPKGSYDPDFKSIYYEEDMGYVDNYYVKNKKYQRCYILGTNGENSSISVKLCAVIIRNDDVDNILVAKTKDLKLKKADILARVNFIEKDYEHTIKML